MKIKHNRITEKRRFIILCIFFITAFNARVNSQSLLDSAKAELLKINKVFDSSRYTAFDVDILYSTDTVYGSFQRQEKKVEYQLNNRNYYFKTDDVIYMQNDSFTVNIDNEQKNMLVTKNIYSDLSNQFMLKDFINHSVNAYDSLYVLTINTVDSTTQKISFNAKPGILNDSMPGYSSFSLTYDTDYYYPVKIEFVLSEKLQGLNPAVDQPLTQKMEIRFNNFRPLESTAIFSDNNYFYFDLSLKRYMPVENYKDYRFLTAGMEDDPAVNPQSLVEQEN